MAELHDPYASLRYAGFRRYLTGNVISLIGYQMQSAAVSWEIYERTNDLDAIATAALMQFLPVLFLSLPSGALADRFERKRIVRTSLSVLAFGSMGLMLVSLYRMPLFLMYGLLLINGTCRAIMQPAKAAMLPLIVPRSVFANAQIWHGSGFQLAMVGGPMLASAIIALTGLPAWVYLLEGLSTALFVVLLAWIDVPGQERSSSPNPIKELAGGLAYVWQNRIIMSAISLDMFAVLLGGATSLLAVYAKVVLNLSVDLAWLKEWSTGLILVREALAIVAPESWPAIWLAWVPGVNVRTVGYGLMRAAPAVGALVTSMLLAQRPPMRKPGRALLWAVVGFGAATIVFGLSRSLWLSLAMLFLTGATDMVSVVIRHALVQLLTPDSMRGRVSAVNGLFIGASNELGGYESAKVAELFDRPSDPSFGPIVSVVGGGVGTIVVVGVIALLDPDLRRLRREDLLSREPAPPT